MTQMPTPVFGWFHTRKWSGSQSNIAVVETYLANSLRTVGNDTVMGGVYSLDGDQLQRSIGLLRAHS